MVTVTRDSGVDPMPGGVVQALSSPTIPYQDDPTVQTDSVAGTLYVDC